MTDRGGRHLPGSESDAACAGSRGCSGSPACGCRSSTDPRRLYCFPYATYPASVCNAFCGSFGCSCAPSRLNCPLAPHKPFQAAGSSCHLVGAVSGLSDPPHRDDETGNLDSPRQVGSVHVVGVLGLSVSTLDPAGRLIEATRVVLAQKAGEGVLSLSRLALVTGGVEPLDDRLGDPRPLLFVVRLPREANVLLTGNRCLCVGALRGLGREVVHFPAGDSALRPLGVQPALDHVADTANVLPLVGALVGAGLRLNL